VTYYKSDKIEIYNQDSFEKLDEIEENSIEAVVTDPPYGLAFMGKDWDDFSPKEYQNWCQEWAEKCLRVLKPGGHLLAFSGNRTHHRAFTGIEDAGFNIRDTLTWHYGSGFPKSSNLKKTIERYSDKDGSEWDGFQTQLKPATEFIVLAQKTLDEDAIYKNVLEHGTGALNIDRCRIGDKEDVQSPWGERKNATDGSTYDVDNGSGSGYNENWEAHDHGRYPANLLLSDGGQALLDNWTEDSKSNSGKNEHSKDKMGYHGNEGGSFETREYGDEGGKSRYFPQFSEPRFKYNPKASKSERTHDGEVENDHPTVKPIDLMSWLVRLVTREGQTVLDPFSGSGSTALACQKERREFIGIEKKEEYCEIIKDRLEADE